MRISSIFLIIFFMAKIVLAISEDEQLNYSPECQKYFQAIKDKNISILPMLARSNSGQCRDYQGRSAMHIFAGIDYFNISYDYIDDFIIRTLIYLGNEDINVSDYYFNTPLMLAAGLGKYSTVAKLLSYPILSDKQYNYMINQQNYLGFTALHYAVIARDYKTIKMLLNRGADRYVKDKNNRSFIDLAQLLERDMALMAFTN